jgi:hypothetical protein
LFLYNYQTRPYFIILAILFLSQIFCAFLPLNVYVCYLKNHSRTGIGIEVIISSFLIYKVLSREVADAVVPITQTLMNLQGEITNSCGPTKQKGLRDAHCCPKRNLCYAWETLLLVGK